MAYHRTRYEIAATHPDGRRLLIAYTPRVSRHGLLAAMRHNAGAVIAVLGIGDADTITWGTQPRPHAITCGWRVEFTGRTQRDARSEGELPFVCDAAKNKAA